MLSVNAITGPQSIKLYQPYTAITKRSAKQYTCDSVDNTTVYCKPEHEIETSK